MILLDEAPDLKSTIDEPVLFFEEIIKPGVLNDSKLLVVSIHERGENLKNKANKIWGFTKEIDFEKQVVRNLIDNFPSDYEKRKASSYILKPDDYGYEEPIHNYLTRIINDEINRQIKMSIYPACKRFAGLLQ
jgi:hypothetical protein